MTPCARSALAIPLAPEAGGHAATLHGELVQPPAARALILRISACEAPAAAASGAAADAASNAATDCRLDNRLLDERLHAGGFATLASDLLETAECRFADAERHLPHLSARLLALLAWLQRQYDADALPRLPVGLVAGGSLTPAAIRAAAVRDRLVDALVCHGGLIDLAGLQHLHALQAPLLLLHASEDRLAAANFEQAHTHLAGTAEKHALPPGGAAAAAFADAAVAWFARHLAGEGRRGKGEG